MPEKFKNKYRITSHRLKNWDYSSNGMYFITIVTQHRICNLGTIVIDADSVETHGRASLQLSDFGKIVDAEWHKSFEIRNELFLNEYIIMPNHLHAIVVLQNDVIMNDTTRAITVENVANVKTDAIVVNVENVENAATVANVTNVANDANVETHGRASLPIQPPQSPSLHRLPKSISSFLAGFKSAVNTKIDDYIDEHQLNIPKYNRNNHFFQPDYYDHIIRDDKSYQRIAEYIKKNPENWKEDKFFNN